MKGHAVTTEDTRAAAQEAAALRDFLLARYADDEREADWYHRLLCLRTACDAEGCLWGPDEQEAMDRERVCTCNYATRLRADIEAKRRIVGYRGPIGLPTDPTVHPWEGRAYLDGGHAAVAAERDRILRLLALPYAAHPDYQQEWAP